MPDPASLYEQDFVRWSEDQAAALREAARSGTNLPLDWENLAEEIDSLGRSQRSELGHRIGTIIEQLLKLQFSSAVEPRRGWEDTIDRERSRTERLLAYNPSLRPLVPETVQDELPRARRHATRALDRHGEASPAVRAGLDAASFTTDEVMGDWFPSKAAPEE
jgi:hypothetical protein